MLTVRTSLLNCSCFSQKPSSGWTRFQQAETLLFHRMKGSQGLQCSLGLGGHRPEMRPPCTTSSCGLSGQEVLCVAPWADGHSVTP